MILYPAIDLLDGAAVQLEGGDVRSLRFRVTDVIGLARRFATEGFSRLHVVDLDGALGTGRNRDRLVELVSGPLPIQVGGGLRTTADVDALLDLGAERVIVGTRAVVEPDWLRRVARRHPGRVVLAADTDGRRVLVRGWTETAPLLLDDLLDRAATLPLAGVLVTDVPREGRLRGARHRFFRRLASRTAHPLLAAGGITTREDLAALRAGGVAGAVLGMSLYSGRLAAAALREYLS